LHGGAAVVNFLECLPVSADSGCDADFSFLIVASVV
jgi:hypothetical protein